ncbi:hypothetical protein [Calothrix rhizosoleniae]|nr:hypothetical protein [Calothrix rhizosoleniae]
MGKPQIAIRIPPSLLEELNGYVERAGTSRTVSRLSGRHLVTSEDG